MRELNNLVRKLTSSETMGSATHICSDKTGTLTKNEMTVMGVMTTGTVHCTDDAAKPIAPAFNSNASGVNIDGTSQNLVDLMFSSIMWNSSAFIEVHTDADKVKEFGKYQTKGNVTEQGIIKFLAQIYDFEACIKRRNELDDGDIAALIPFSSKRKRASIAVYQRNSNTVRVYSKGAPDMLMLNTTNILEADGSTVALDDQTVCPARLPSAGHEVTHRDVLNQTIKFFADQALRTILVCYKDIDIDTFNDLRSSNNNFEKAEDRECLEDDLTAIGIFGIMDPLRDGIKESIELCRKAGIRAIMCTGDNLDTAKAISRNAGILQPGDD
jgi:magnesium-transporting ATPase (P-type)